MRLESDRHMLHMNINELHDRPTQHGVHNFIKKTTGFQLRKCMSLAYYSLLPAATLVSLPSSDKKLELFTYFNCSIRYNKQITHKTLFICVYECLQTI